MENIDFNKRYLVIARNGTFGPADSNEYVIVLNENTDLLIASADEFKEALTLLTEAKMENQELEMVVFDQEERFILRPRYLGCTDGATRTIFKNCPDDKETGLSLLFSRLGELK